MAVRGRRTEPLNEMQRAFVRELLADPAWNGTAAAKRAGYKSASAAAGKLMKDPRVKRAIEGAVAERNRRNRINQDAVLDELACVAYLDIRSLLDEDGRPIPLEDLPDEITRSIKSFEVRVRPDGTTVYEIVPHDKLAALALLAKHVGIGADVHNHLHLHGQAKFDWASLYGRPDQSPNVVDVPRFAALPDPASVAPAYDIEEVGDASE